MQDLDISEFERFMKTALGNFAMTHSDKSCVGNVCEMF